MRSTQWEDTKLGELGEFSNGVNFTRDQMGKSDSHSIKLINVKDLYNDSPYLKFEGLDHITLKSVDKYRGYSVKKHDIFFARSSVKRDGVGVVELAHEDNDECVHCGFVIRFRPTSKKVDTLYLTYLLRSPFYRQAIINLSSGATITNIAQGNLRKLPILHPPLPVQQKIAAILSAYDDLIENNNKRIALLEKAAEEIYREWFIRMRFPGWEQVKFVKGIPADWEVIKVADAFEFLGGGTPSTTEKRYWDDGTVNWFTPSDITKANGIFLPESIDKCTEEGLNNSSARMFPAYSVMMTSRATIGAIGINTTPACTNQGFITCIPNENFPLTFLYHWLKLNKPHFELLATGATFAELTKGTFKKIKIIKPEKTLVEQYDEKVAPMFKEMESLLQKVVLLRQSRDLLLSRLISGKLSVEALDIRFPPSMIAQ